MRRASLTTLEQRAFKQSRAVTAFTGLLLSVTIVVASCNKASDTTEAADTTSASICIPGENIFCRCPGGEAGTHQCNPDGKTYDTCATREGACPSVSKPSSSSSSPPFPESSSSSGENDGSGGNGGNGGIGAGGDSAGSGGMSGTSGNYLAPCTLDSDCDSAKCRNGYCTIDCTAFDDCILGTGECISTPRETICMPICVSTTDCIAFGIASECGYTDAIDRTPVTICADWGDNLQVAPPGTICADDGECSLGNPGYEAVCSSQTCTIGCHTDDDCPLGTTCSGTNGDLGSCN